MCRPGSLPSGRNPARPSESQFQGCTWCMAIPLHWIGSCCNAFVPSARFGPMGFSPHQLLPEATVQIDQNPKFPLAPPGPKAGSTWEWEVWANGILYVPKHHLRTNSEGLSLQDRLAIQKLENLCCEWLLFASATVASHMRIGDQTSRYDQSLHLSHCLPCLQMGWISEAFSLLGWIAQRFWTSRQYCNTFRPTLAVVFIHLARYGVPYTRFRTMDNLILSGNARCLRMA